MDSASTNGTSIPADHVAATYIGAPDLQRRGVALSISGWDEQLTSAVRVVCGWVASSA